MPPAKRLGFRGGLLSSVAQAAFKVGCWGPEKFRIPSQSSQKVGLALELGRNNFPPSVPLEFVSYDEVKMDIMLSV